MPDLVVSSIGTVSSSSSSDSTLCSDLIEATKRHLYTGSREQRNTLAADINASVTSLGVNYALAGIQVGSRLSIDTEDMYVLDAAATSAITVQRGQFGSSAATHTANTTVVVNAKFSDAEIFRALNDELRDLSSPVNGLYQMKTVDLTWSAGVQGYDMTNVSDMLGVYEVRWKLPDISASWPKVSHYTTARNLASDEFASGFALIIYESPIPGREVRVSYKAPFGLLSTSSDNILAVTGLHPQAHDILAIGAAIRLTVGREIKRNFSESQGDTRRAEEVPPGANLNASRQLQALRAQRVAAEAARLSQSYPVTRGWV